MGRQRSKTEEARERRAHTRRQRLLVAGFLGVAVLAGVATWYFFQGQSPLSAVPSYQGGPRLAVDREEIDFGPVRFEKQMQARFRVRNVGDQPLQIADTPPVEVVEGC